MKRRVMMGNRRVTILPYVKSNKSGIDTGVSVGDNIAFQIDFRGYDSTNEQAIFGSWQYDGNIYGVVFMNNRWYYGYGGYNELSVSMLHLLLPGKQYYIIRVRGSISMEIK